MNVLSIKAAVRTRDGHRCTECGMTEGQHYARYGRGLHVHRIIPGSAYTLAGCVTLCYACHGPKPKLPAGQGARPAMTVALMPHDLHAAFVRFAHESRQTKTAVIISALKQYLGARGYWPPPEDPTTPAR